MSSIFTLNSLNMAIEIVANQMEDKLQTQNYSDYDFMDKGLHNVLIKNKESIANIIFNSIDGSIELNNNRDKLIKLLNPKIHEINKASLFFPIDEDNIVDSLTEIYVDEFINILQRENLIISAQLEDIRLKTENNILIESNSDVVREFAFLGNKRLGAVERSEFKILDNGDERNDLLFGQKRKDVLNEVSSKLEKTLEKCYDGVYNGDKNVNLLKAPTGSGKTSRLISILVKDKRTYEDMVFKVGEETFTERRPIIVLMPNHQNISEAVARAKMLCLNPKSTDEKLAQELVDCNFCDDLESAYSKLDEARDSIRMCGRDSKLPKLNISILTSRSRSGCKKTEEISLLSKAGIGQSSLCVSKNKNKETGKQEERYCEFYNECQFIRERKKLHNAHIVFMPHAYATNKNIPEELNNPRFVVIDERIQEQILNYRFLNLIQLTQGRQRTIDLNRNENSNFIPVDEDELKKYEKRKASYESFMRKERARVWCSEQLINCSNENSDPAQFFIKLQESYIKSLKSKSEDEIIRINKNEDELPSPISCLNLALSALNECSKRDPRISPTISKDLLANICSAPGSSTINDERKMWEIIQDGITNIYLGRGYKKDENDNFINDENLLIDDNYIGNRDYRIQFLNMRGSNNDLIKNTIRISWREEMNWKDSQLLLLDASAYEPIIEKIWNDRKVVTTNVVEDFGKLLNVKIVAVVDHAWSNSSLLATGSSSFSQLVSAGISLASIRDATSVISSAHADGRVLVAGSKNVRKALQHNWFLPNNVDTCHFGALRGIDEWKYHSATISIGRMDLPIEVIDAMSACLSWDDDNPELPFNIYGNGFADEDGTKPLFQGKYNREIKMRNGKIANFGIPMVSGKWGQLCQKQSREEELLQFLGRLRPIYRTGKVPVHYAFSSVIPEGLILDDCVTIHDIIGDDKSGLLSQDKQEKLISKEWKVNRENQAILTRILDTSIRIHGGMICPEVLVNDTQNLDIEYKYRNIKSIMKFLEMRGFNIRDEVSTTQSMADGWSLYAYSISGDIIKPIWVASTLYKNELEAMDNISQLLSYYLNCNIDDIEIGVYNVVIPEKDVGVSFDSSAIELLELSNKNIQKTNDFISFLKSKMFVDEDTKEKKYFIKEMNCENYSIPFSLARKKYFIHDKLSDFMFPKPKLTEKQSIKDNMIRNYVSNYGLYYHQLMGVLSLQDIQSSNNLDSIVTRIESIPNLQNIDNKDNIDMGISVVNDSLIIPDNNTSYKKMSDISFVEFFDLCL